jgi:hypothetical protein
MTLMTLIVDWEIAGIAGIAVIARNRRHRKGKTCFPVFLRALYG